MHDHGALLGRQHGERGERAAIRAAPGDRRAGTCSSSSASRAGVRARAASIARFTTIRCSHGPNGRRRSKRSRLRTRRGTPPGRCPRRAPHRGRRGTRRGAPAASGRGTAPRGQRRIRAGRRAPRHARPGLRAPPQDHTTARPREVHAEIRTRRRRRSRDLVARAATYHDAMNRRELLAAAAAAPLALASPREHARRGAGGTARRPRHGRHRVARRRARPRHGPRACADPDAPRARAASRAPS